MAKYTQISDLWDISVSYSRPLQRDGRQQPFQEWNKSELHHPVPSKVKPIHVLLMHAPLIQKAGSVPAPNPTPAKLSGALCVHWLACLVALLRNATFVRTFLWFMLSLQHRLSSGKVNHLTGKDSEALNTSRAQTQKRLRNLIKYF